MLVTRHFSTKIGTNSQNISHGERFLSAKNGQFAPLPANDRPWKPTPPTKVQLVGFCDWLSIYQQHGGGLPVIADGAFVRVDKHGETDSVTLKKERIEGSFESAVFVRCDGSTVWFEGNVSKFGRPDNVFGYSFRDCIERINQIVESLGLPRFTDGERFISNFKGQPRSVWTGARVTRIDITQNLACGSKEDAYHFMRFLSGQQSSRLKTGTHGEGETVDYGRHSRRLYFKVYNKGAELRKHADKHVDGAYINQLADWCDSIGLVRAELTVKATKLHDMGCNYLGGFDMKQIELEFAEKCEVFTRASAEVDQLASLSKPLLSTYRMWQAGDDIVSKLSRNTFYRHRRELLPHGVDIAIKSNVVPLKTKTRVIKLGPVSAPEWYELPQVERKRYGNGC